MTDSIEFVHVEEGDKVVGSLAACFETGLGSALKGIAQQSASAACLQIKKTDLLALLSATPVPTCAVEIRYAAGIEGCVLFLISLTDMVSLSEVISGAESRGGGALDSELLDACQRFFTRGTDDANASFSADYVPVTSAVPELLNPDGKDESLAPLANLYCNSLCALYRLTVEPRLDIQIRMLVQPEVIRSLHKRLPDLDRPRHEGADSNQRDGARLESGNRSQACMEPVEMDTSRSSQSASQPSSGNWNIDLLLDVELPISVSFGETEMFLKDVLKLGAGSVIELDKSVNDAVTVIVNRKAIAKGEVVMVEGNYGVRILEIESAADRIRSMG